MNIYQFFQPIIFNLEAERAHNLAIKYLKFLPKFSTLFCNNHSYENLQQNICGLNFDNPVGLSAGFDKNAEIISTLFRFGFGFVEAGTVTPIAQSGNEMPRLFRLKEDKALINRLGFNNLGADYFYHNIAKLPKTANKIIGINIGKNKDTQDFYSDYLQLLEKFYLNADYITINISSPNTKNLRDIQNVENLTILIEKLTASKNSWHQIHQKNTPLFLKIAPDLSINQLEDIASVALKYQIDGVIISNTTIARSHDLKSQNSTQNGGLSGAPLFNQSTAILKEFHRLTKGQIKLIGVGGISNGAEAYEKIKSGASLIQIYSAFIYQGFSLVEEIKKYLSDNLKKDGFKNISEAVGILNK